MTAVLTVLVCLGAVIGAVAGFFKKFTKTSFWGVTALLALLLERAIGAGVKKGSDGYGLAVIISTVAVLIIFSIIFFTLQKLLGKAVEARRRLSHYKNYDDVEENEELILNAVDNGDRRQYKKLLRKRKRIKDSGGLWGLLDGVFGAISGCLNGLVGVGAVVVCLLLFVDLTQLSFLTGAFGNVLASGGWLGLGTQLALDLPLVCLLSVSVRVGYNSGISSVLCFAVVLGLLVGFGYASWSIACSDACDGVVVGLKNGALSQVAGTLGDSVTYTVAKLIIAGIIFVFSLIIVIVVGMLLPKIMDRFRDNVVFSAVDGVMGAVVLCAVICMVMIALGGVAYTLNDLAFMEGFNRFAGQAHLGDGIYTYNPMAQVWAQLPLRGMFGNAQ